MNKNKALVILVPATLAIAIAVLLCARAFFPVQGAAAPSSQTSLSAGATPEPPGPGTFTISQTLSDGAQMNTIAFDGLAFLTGSMGADSFFPPGKVADFWGFQYLRDNDPSEMGHNTDFLTRASLNMLYVLTTTQRAELIALAQSQVEQINQYATNRFILMKAFRRQLAGDLPDGSSGLDKAAVMAYSAQLYRLDGEISYARAQMMGKILSELDDTQRAYLDAMVGQGMLTWPVVGEPDELRGLDQDVKVAVMTYAGDLFSWYAGSVEADVYFCPERQGTYFGSFYMKDAPAVGNPGYSIPVTLTADMGATFLQTITPVNAEIITGLVSEQKSTLYEIVDRRQDVSLLLRQFISGTVPSESEVLSLMERYGELDGDIVYRYATAFAQINQNLDETQQAELAALRIKILGDLSVPSGAFSYAEPISIPVIANTDFLFTRSNVSTLTYPVVDTGQGKCYNNSVEITCPSAGSDFYGQDAQNTGSAPSYTDNGYGTVSDNLTGLVWQKSPDTNGDGAIDASDKMTASEAAVYCQDLVLDGSSDWRLPSIKQLYSLIDFSGLDPSSYEGTDTSSLTPFINISYFDFAYGDTSAGERIIDAQYVSSNAYAASSSKVFGVNFADGRIKGYDLTMLGGSEKTFYVQCVRGNEVYGINSFTDNGDGTITDQATGLTWSQADSGSAMNWQEALDWVQARNAENYQGHSDWRLPDAKELQSILDYSRSPDTSSSAAIDPVFSATSFTNEDGVTDWPWYWSSTTHAAYNGMGASAAYLAFGRAGGWMKIPPSASCYTLVDVHGAGAQRSDPKTSAGLVLMGSACSGGTAYGLGPQGDVQRAANYVRLVRDADTEVQPTPTATSTPTQTSTPTPSPSMTASPTNTPTPTPTSTITPPPDPVTLDNSLYLPLVNRGKARPALTVGQP
jgi:hypothetical protein